MYKMERTYKETSAVIETQLIYIESHLKNIDQHLNNINTDAKANRKDTDKNTNNIKWIIRLGGSIFTLILVVIGLIQLVGS